MTFSVFGERVTVSEQPDGLPSRWVGLGNLPDDKSPCQLVGSVWYDLALLTDTAAEVGKYTITDNLDNSGDMWQDQFQGAKGEDGPIVQYSITPWGGETLYVISKGVKETRGNVQKIDLTDAGADWWVDIGALEAAGTLRDSVDDHYKRPVFYYPEGLLPLKRIGGQPLSTPDLPPFRGEQSSSDGYTGESTGWPFGGNGKANRAFLGWVHGDDKTNYALPGFSDTKFGALCEDGPRGHTGIRERIAFVEVGGAGAMTKELSNAKWIKGREMRDASFLYTHGFSTPAKVLPLAVAPNDWPYGIGAFVETKEVSRHVQTWKLDMPFEMTIWEGCLLESSANSLLDPGDSSYAPFDYDIWFDEATNGTGTQVFKYWLESGDSGSGHVSTIPTDDNFTAYDLSDHGTLIYPEYPENWPANWAGWIPWKYPDGEVVGGVWGCVRLLSGLVLGMPTPSNTPLPIGYFTIDHELGYAKFQYRVRYCAGEIKSAVDGLPYIDTGGGNIVYETPWVNYYGGVGNLSPKKLNWNFTKWEECGKPEKISVVTGEGDELDPINRYWAQVWNPDFELDPGGAYRATCESVDSPKWVRTDKIDLIEGTQYEPANLFGDLGANHDFVGGISFYNSTENHKPVFLIDYEKENTDTVLPTYNPVNQDGQTPGYRAVPEIVPPVIGWTTYQRLIFNDHIIWDSYDKVDPTKTYEDLNSVDVLTGDRIAVITSKPSEDGEIFPQKLSVYTAGGASWSIKSSTPVAVANGARSVYARIISCSDRWIYISMFPLQVKTVDEDKFVDGADGCARNLDLPKAGQVMHFHQSNSNWGLPEHSWSNWLISLDGATTVPARIDLPLDIRPLPNLWYWAEDEVAAVPSLANWVSSWTVIGNSLVGPRIRIKWDAPRVSGVIDAVSVGTMDPATFF